MKNSVKSKGIIFVCLILIIAILVPLFRWNRMNYIDQTVKKYHPEGTSIILIHHGEIADVKNYGFASKENGKAVTQQTKFKIASISKTVTAYGVMQLVDEGVLDLDAPVNTYLKSWKIPDGKFDADKVTLRTLMSHTSGITGSDELGYSEPLPSIAQALKQRNIHLKREPGSKFEYSEFAGFGICQLVIEDVTGMKFEDYMKQEVFEDLGMRNTDYANDGKTFATPYAGNADPVAVTPIVMNGGGGVATTSEDLAHFVQGLIHYYNTGSKKMFEAQKNATSSGGEYALGIIPRRLANGKTVYEHNGTLTGWNAQIAFEPESGEGIVVVSNSDKSFYMTYELMKKWGKNTLGAPVIDEEINHMHKAFYTVIAILGILCLFILFRQLYNVRCGKFIKDKSKKIYIRMAITLVFVVLYYICIFTSVAFQLIYHMDNYYLFTFFPKESIFINLEFIIFALLWILGARYKRVCVSKMKKMAFYGKISK